MLAPRRVLCFDAFSLDLARCALLRGDEVLALRPQAFDVLRHLAERPGHVVTKDELIAAVWAAKPASDDSLVQCIKDIRQALSDHTRRIVQTVPRRGYMLAAEVVEEAAAPPSRPSLPEAVLEASPPRASDERGLVAAVSRRAPNGLWRPARLAVAGVVVTLSGALLVAYQWRTPDAGFSAAHYSRLGRAILQEEPGRTRANLEALAYFDKALAVDPDHVPALLGKASAHIRQVHEHLATRDEAPVWIDAAAAAIDRALRLEPRNAAVLRGKGVVLRARRDPEGAVAALLQALALDPKSAWTHAQLGRARIDLGQPEEALADIEKAIALSASEPALHIWLYWAGMAALHAGKDEAALAWLLKARLPGGSIYRFALLQISVAYTLLGRDTDGRETLAMYRARWPGLSLAGLKQDLGAHNPSVSAQRERIFAALRRLGVPEGPVKAARF
jgi:DNA-binding winged helix-turn-helix (wHTH) protein/tetratricopeptide (TPR) repeat protein